MYTNELIFYVFAKLLSQLLGGIKGVSAEVPNDIILIVNVKKCSGTKPYECHFKVTCMNEYSFKMNKNR